MQVLQDVLYNHLYVVPWKEKVQTLKKFWFQDILHRCNFRGKIAQLKDTEHLKTKFQGQLIHNNSPDILWLWHVGKSLIKSCKGLKETKQGLSMQYKLLHIWNCFTVIAYSKFHYYISHLLGSIHAVIGQFSRQYSPVWPT